MFKKLKEFFSNARDTIKDDRFGWQFKLCNIITNDYLRNYLACNNLIIEDTVEYMRNHNTPEWITNRLERVSGNIKDIFKW